MEIVTGVKRATVLSHSCPLDLFEKRKQMTKFISKFVADESGATAIEYGLIAALIAVVIIATITTLGTNLKATFNEVAIKLGGTAG